MWDGHIFHQEHIEANLAKSCWGVGGIKDAEPRKWGWVKGAGNNQNGLMRIGIWVGLPPQSVTVSKESPPRLLSFTILYKPPFWNPSGLKARAEIAEVISFRWYGLMQKWLNAFIVKANGIGSVCEMVRFVIPCARVLLHSLMIGCHQGICSF